MKSFQERLIYAMNKRNLKQSDLVKMTGINKGALSSYINGRYEPKQNNVFLLSKALNVNEAWLLGYDVEMDNNNQNIAFGSELDKIINDISKKLELSPEIIKNIFLDLKINTSLELNYENVMLEIKKNLLEKFNKNWDDNSNKLELQLLGFRQLLKSIGWNYDIKEDTKNEIAYYELTNGEIKLKITNEEFSKLSEGIISKLKNDIQAMIIKSSNIFDD